MLPSAHLALEPSPSLSSWPRHTSGLTSRLVLNYVERAGGRSAVDAVLARCGLTAHEPQLRDPTLWFDFPTKLALFEAAGAVLGQDDVAWHIGRAAIELRAVAGLKVALRALGSPRLAYAAVPSVSERFTRAHRTELITLSDRVARFRYSDASGVGYHEADCRYTAGLLSSVPTLFGALPAQGRHRTCAVRGASECIYEVQWEGRNVIGTHLGAGLLGATAAGVAMTAPRRWRAPLVLPAIGAVIGARRAVDRSERRRRLLEVEVHDQEQAAERLTTSLRDLVSDLRIEEVLPKVIENAQDALLGREIAVVTTGGDGVRACGSERLGPRALAVLEAWVADNLESLDEPRTQRPLEEVPDLSGLASDPETPLGGLHSVPLAFRGARFGVLVALAHGSEAFLPKETAMLELYAAEASIALGNARFVARLEALARQDSLTGLLNHREFQNVLARELEQAQRHEEVLSVAMLDLDGFKRINDEHGHAEGDRLLQVVADGLNALCGDGEVAGRLGGDEFAVILRRQAAPEAERVMAGLDEELVSAGVDFGVSWGIAEWPKAGPSQSLLLYHADRALYEAKAARQDGTRRHARIRTGDVDAALLASDHRRGLTAALARAVDAKDSYTRSHCETVAELCAATGHELGFDAPSVRKLRLAGLLHDVGKIGIADAILQKPERLTEEEYEVMKTHAPYGHSILFGAELFDEAHWVLRHHERIDGRGYPDGLSGDAIPLESRIILVADAFEAMTSDRPYRRGRAEAEALDDLRSHAGTQFDPECVAALARVLRHEPRGGRRGEKELAPVRRRASGRRATPVLEAVPDGQGASGC